ncbi:MAG: DUF2127 domain-containing protein [Actinobacteria bacterium]|nr:DUF2127 domain-containing protein [Actinomycetota bacterium]
MAPSWRWLSSGRYLTVVATATFLPLEIYEIAEKASLLRDVGVAVSGPAPT